MIRKKEIEHIGWLARIELSETEKVLFEAQLSSILDYSAVLDELGTEDAWRCFRDGQTSHKQLIIKGKYSFKFKKKRVFNTKSNRGIVSSVLAICVSV